MKMITLAGSALLAGSAIAQTLPTAPAPLAPMSHQMGDRTTTRAETVAKIREHFSRMDADRNGAISKSEIDGLHARRAEDFERFEHRGAAMPKSDPNTAFDRLDTDKNGWIGRDEFAKGREERIERRLPRGGVQARRAREHAVEVEDHGLDVVRAVVGKVLIHATSLAGVAP